MSENGSGTGGKKTIFETPEQIIDFIRTANTVSDADGTYEDLAEATGLTEVQVRSQVTMMRRKAKQAGRENPIPGRFGSSGVVGRKGRDFESVWDELKLGPAPASE